MPSDSKREPLPFEPKSAKKAESKPGAAKVTKPDSEKAQRRQSAKPAVQGSDGTDSSPSAEESVPIPEVVSRRMIRRMGVFAGVPTFLGMASFVVSYVLLTRHIAEFPNVVVLFVSLGFFGLGTLGLSYGVLSASWQEEEEGSLLGISEFKVNFKRLVAGLRDRKKKPPTSE